MTCGLLLNRLQEVCWSDVKTIKQKNAKNAKKTKIDDIDSYPCSVPSYKTTNVTKYY